jgi:hypothetical protein
LERTDWDRQVTLPVDAPKVLAEAIRVIERNAELGQPLWPFIASSLYAARAVGLSGGRLLILNEWDASHLGWGGFVSWKEERRMVVAPFRDTEDMQVQVRREAMGGYLMFKATTRMLDARGAVILHRNDCVPALAALRKGSFPSPPLQATAVAFNRLAETMKTEHYFLHAPGAALVAEGIDEASRAGAEQVHFPACTENMRTLMRQMAGTRGWTITVDLFATETNALTPRFFSRYAEPGTEAVDAMSVSSWNSSRCPACGATHRETVFAFPPIGLIRPMVRKLAVDGARGLVVVPTAVTSAHWQRLLAVALPRSGVPRLYRRLRHLRNLLQGTGGLLENELAVFAVDFGKPWETGAV